MSSDSKENALKHKQKMQRHKEKVDSHIAQANIEQGIAVLLTGNGKGKSTSAFGMVCRALGYQQKVAIVQFIKGAQSSGEIEFLRAYKQVSIHQMGTGFTWNTQDKEKDVAAATSTWQHAARFLTDPNIDLVVLDELTYMLAYKYLDSALVIDAIENRPKEQSVIVTGRGGGKALRAVMDTISEVKNIQHAFEKNIKARKGVDF